MKFCFMSNIFVLLSACGYFSSPLLLDNTRAHTHTLTHTHPHTHTHAVIFPDSTLHPTHARNSLMLMHPIIIEQ